ncbi:hypothetical protein GCM10010317_007040 [Streptomyces mirabilis]|jgi:uncharacterized protein YbjT (DUF2867 family)|nr:hypothetical protein GCM10010317_007040 [Streptomyces mirabilis]
MRVVVAGATGLIGSRTVARLRDHSVEVVPVSRGEGVHVAPVLMRPVSPDDITAALAHVAVGVPLFGVLEVAGPEEYHLDELTATLLPDANAHLGHGTFAEWLARR